LEHLASALDSDREQIAVQQDTGQQVVEVVRDPAGEAADDLHLFSFA